MEALTQHSEYSRNIEKTKISIIIPVTIPKQVIKIKTYICAQKPLRHPVFNTLLN